MPESDDFMDEAAHTLLLPFDTDSPDFARGFEAGRVWTLLGTNEDVVEVEVHAANTEMVMRMAEATDRVASGEVIDDVWNRVRFEAPQ